MNILSKNFCREVVEEINLDKKSLSDYLKNICEDLERSKENFNEALNISGPVKRKENRDFFFNKIQRLEKEKMSIKYFITN